MKTTDVKVGMTVFYKGEIVTVLERIKGGETNKVMMQSGIMPDGFHRRPKKFRLSNGAVVRADKFNYAVVGTSDNEEISKRIRYLEHERAKNGWTQAEANEYHYLTSLLKKEK